MRDDLIVLSVAILSAVFVISAGVWKVRSEQEIARKYAADWSDFKWRCFNHHGREAKNFEQSNKEQWGCFGFTHINQRTKELLYSMEYNVRTNESKTSFRSPHWKD